MGVFNALWRNRTRKHIRTAQNSINCSEPATWIQNVNRLARMEQEKAGLELELSVWASKQRQTEERLKEIRQQIELLLRGLGEPLSAEVCRDGSTQRTADA